MLKAFLGAAYWSKAQALSASRQYTKAMRELEKLYGLYDAVIPSPKVGSDTNLLTALIAIGMRDFGLAQLAVAQVLNGIDADKSLSVNDKNYVKRYCKWILEYCRDNAPYVLDFKIEEIEHATFDEQKVKWRIRRTFPFS